MATPAFRAAGTGATGASSITPGLPAGHTTNDILLCFVQTSNENGAGVPTNSTSGTWVEITNSPIGVGTAASAGSVGLRVYWMRDAGAAIGTVTVPDSGNHQVAFICAYSGCVTTGNPWQINPAAATESPSSTLATFPTGGTTTRNNCLIVFVVANALDGTAAQYSSNNTNPNTSTPVNRTPATCNTSTGTGGGLSVLDGTLNTAGAIGILKLNMVGTSTNYAEMVIALPGPIAFTQSLTATFSPTGTLTRTLNKVLSATFSPTGAMNLFTSHLLTATLSPIGALTKFLTKTAFAAQASFVGAFIKTTLKPFSGATSFTGLFGPSVISKAMTATFSPTGALTRFTSHAETAALSFVGALTRMTSKLMSARLILGTAPNVIFMESGTDATQSTSFYTSTAGTVTSDSAGAITGPRSLKFALGSPAAGCNAIKGAVLNSTQGRISLSFKIDTVPAATTQITQMLTAANAVVANITLTTGMKLAFTPTGVSGATGTTTLNTNTPYWIGVSYVIATSASWTFNVYINGKLEVSLASTGTLTNTTPVKLQLILQAAAGDNVNAWFDNIYIDGSSDLLCPGMIIVTNKRAFANGALNEWTTAIGGVPGSPYGTGHAQEVNEQPLSVTNGWSIASASLKTEEYSVEGAAVGDIDVSDASSYALIDYMGWVHAKVGSAGTRNIIVNGVASNISLTTTATTFFKAAGSTTYPSGNAAIGMDNNSVNNLTSLYECGVLLALIQGPRLSFSGSLSLAHLFNQAFTATLNFVGAINLSTAKALAAVFSPSGAMTRQTNKLLPEATLNFVGALLRQTNKVFSASLSFIGDLATQFIAGSQTFFQSFTATLSSTGDLIRQTNKSLTAQTSFTGTLTRNIGKILSATFTPTAALTKSSTKSFSAATTPTGSLTRQTAKSLSGTTSSTGVLIRQIGKLLTAAQTFTGNLTRVIQKLLPAATTSFVGNLTKQTTRSFTAVVSFVGDLATHLFSGPQVFFQSFAATLSSTGLLNLKTSKSFTAAQSFVALLTKNIQKTLPAATASFTGSLSRITQKVFGATASPSGALTRRTSHLMTATLSSTGTLTKNIRTTFTASVSFLGSLTISRLFFMAFTATANFTGNLVRQTNKTFSATQDFTSSLSRNLAKIVTATLTPTGNLSRQTNKAAFEATLSFVASFTATMGQLFAMAFDATLALTGDLKKQTNKVFSATLGFFATFLTNFIARIIRLAKRFPRGAKPPDVLVSKFEGADELNALLDRSQEKPRGPNTLRPPKDS